jgi:hypothetical protein
VYGHGIRQSTAGVPSRWARKVVEPAPGRAIASMAREVSCSEFAAGSFPDAAAPEANELLVEISGQIHSSFAPSDPGPFGEVGEPGLLLHMVGHQRFTLVDPDQPTERIVDYSFNGRTTDVCALLSD